MLPIIRLWSESRSGRSIDIIALSENETCRRKKKIREYPEQKPE